MFLNELKDFIVQLNKPVMTDVWNMAGCNRLGYRLGTDDSHYVGRADDEVRCVYKYGQDLGL